MTYDCNAFIRYVQRQGCEIELDYSTSERVLTLVNPINGKMTHLFRKKHDDRIEYETITINCMRLGIGIPGHKDLI